VIYYSYMQEPDSAEDYSIYFFLLLSADTFALFLDECAWLIQGMPSMAMVNRIINALLYQCSGTIILLFWRYSAHMLHVPADTKRTVDRILVGLLGLIFCALVANFFTPLLFSVDGSGVYRREAFFPLALLPVLVIALPLIRALIRYDGPAKLRKTARLFLLMPLAGLVLSCIQFGISMQYTAVLLSVLLALGVIVSYRGRCLTAIRTELTMAMQIQESMLPNQFPAFPDHPEFDLYASMDPAREVGGDFYDFFLTDDGHLALIIADVSDKGVPAALLMMSAKILIHYRARQGGTPAQILADVNDELCDSNESGMFVTVWMGILDCQSGALVCANAGHEKPAVKRAGGAYRLLQDRHGPPVGIMPGIRYHDYTVQISPGDAVFVYTDGVPEANNLSGEAYGLQRMERALNALEDPSPAGVLRGVRADVDAFVGGAKQFDDLTMLCMEYRG